MNTTAISIIRRAMRLIRVLGQDEDPTAEESQDGFDALLAMVDAWGIDGDMASDTVALPTFASLAATVDAPDGLVQVLVYNLALEIAPEYGKEPSQEVVRKALAYKRNYANARANENIEVLAQPAYYVGSSNSTYNVTTGE